jgi:hypothetical protein
MKLSIGFEFWSGFLCGIGTSALFLVAFGVVEKWLVRRNEEQKNE